MMDHELFTSENLNYWYLAKLYYVIILDTRSESYVFNYVQSYEHTVIFSSCLGGQKQFLKEVDLNAADHEEDTN